MNCIFHISQPINPQQVLNFETKSVGNWVYFSNSEYSLATTDNVLRYVSIFPLGTLPYGLDWTDNNVKIVTKLGEPDKKTSSKALGIEITYERLGISIEFWNCDWNDLDNRVKSVIVFGQLEEKDFLVDRMAKICAVCKEVGSFRCGMCKLFNYCSRECQVKHWTVHKEQCKIISKGRK